MRIAGVAKALHVNNLKLLKQICVDDFVYYNMKGMPRSFEELSTFRENDDRGFIRVGHVPLVVTEVASYDGDEMYGNTFAIGYLKGHMESVF